MAFWSSEKLQSVAEKLPPIAPYDPKRVVQGAYELSLGPEAFLTSDEDNTKQILGDGEQLVIPPGQFGLLLTEETVDIPTNVLAFISIKAGIKFRGLINVSGFHVDPGFRGRLKFSVYNAGSKNIVLERKQRLFLIWFADLDQATVPYSGSHSNQMSLSPDDVMRIQGEVASPGQLKNDIQDLKDKTDMRFLAINGQIETLKSLVTVFLTLIVALAAFSLRGCLNIHPSNDAQRSIVPATNTVQSTTQEMKSASK